MKLAVEPEDEMVEVGNELLKPPAEEDPLLELLGRAELLLSKVEQSPQPAMLRALDPVMKGLVANELLRHPNTDVKVAVASCISEITRVTAPEAPYDDDLMKVIFELIVEAFGGLNESPQSSQTSYRRRLSILETVAKVRSCVVMLDLECDGLILEMFRHFFRARRASHPDSAYSLIETIMTVVLEESEDFSSELIFCLLDSVKKDNKDASRELGESVIGKCGAKLKPYLLKEIQSIGVPLSDYSRIVASVCQKSSDVPDNNELSAPGLEDDSKLSERTVSEDLQQGSAKMDGAGGSLEDVETGRDKSPEPVISNGIALVIKDGSFVEPASPSVHSEQALHGDSKGTEASIIGKGYKVDSLGGRADKGLRQNAKKSKSCKDNYSAQSTEISDHSPMDIEKDMKEPNSKEVKNSQNEIALDKKLESASVSDDQKGSEQQLSKGSNKKNDSISDASRPKRGRPPGSKTSAKKGKIELPASPSISKKDSARDEDELRSAKGSDKNMEVEGTLNSGGKPSKSPSNMECSMVEDSEKPPSDAHLNKSDEQTNDVQVSPVKQSKRKADRTAENELSKEPQIRKGRPRKSGKENPSEAISLSEETGIKANAEKDQDTPDKTPRKKSRNRVITRPENSMGLDEKLVGSNIRVWWPDDKEYYPGVIDSYNPDTKKHTVLYADGDVEVLLLEDERWHLVDDDILSDVERAGKSGDAAEEDSSQIPPKKKAKISSDSASKKTKGDNSVKRGSAGKVKGDGKRGSDRMKSADNQDVDAGTPERAKKSKEKSGGSSGKHSTPGITGKKTKEKSSNKSKTSTPDSAETGSGKKDRTPKPRSDSKDETTSKSSKKSKDANPEADARARDVASPSSRSEKKNVKGSVIDSGGPKTARKSKGGNTPKSGSKLAANGTATKERSSLKVEATEDSSPKTQEGSRKRGRPPKS